MPPNPKLLSLAAASALRARWRTEGRKVVLTNGVFDLLHPGHVHSLQQARALGDALIVCMNSDASVRALKGPSRPIVNQEGRAFCLAGLACVDAVVLFETERLDAEIRALSPDVYAKAGDYAPDRLNPAERSALEACETALRFTPFLEGFSTTSLIAKMESAPHANS